MNSLCIRIDYYTLTFVDMVTLRWIMKKAGWKYPVKLTNPVFVMSAGCPYIDLSFHALVGRYRSLATVPLAAATDRKLTQQRPQDLQVCNSRTWRCIQTPVKILRQSQFSPASIAEQFIRHFLQLATGGHFLLCETPEFCAQYGIQK
jgi:hypothetical protein